MGFARRLLSGIGVGGAYEARKGREGSVDVIFQVDRRALGNLLSDFTGYNVDNGDAAKA